MPSFARKVKISSSRRYRLFSAFNNVVVDEADCNQLQFLNLVFKIGEKIVATTDATTGNVEDTQNSLNTWLCAVRDPLPFAACVAACWTHGKIPVLSADLQVDTLNDLSSSLAGVLADEAFEIPGEMSGVSLVRIDCIDPYEADGDAVGDEFNRSVENPSFDADETAMVFYTSGSTGQKKRIDKPFFALFEEVINLEAQFGPSVHAVSHRSTVSHFHIYGFLFNVLWPLHFGHMLSAPTTFYWEQALHDGADGACIVSSPAHLRFMCSAAKDIPFNWEKSIVFSSGGPLDRMIALDIFQLTGQAPVEVFGSTETGGIAFRQQDTAEPKPFTPFSRVEIRINARDGLEVYSPWIGCAPGTWTETGDSISLTSTGAFFLRGRYDTVVKIAGKRVSLAEMEQMLNQQEHIVRCRVFQYSDDMAGGRAALAAVMAIGMDAALPTGTDKLKWVKTLKDHLRRRFDLVTLPRYWRFVHEIPVDSQGKTTLKMLGEIVENGS